MRKGLPLLLLLITLPVLAVTAESPTGLRLDLEVDRDTYAPFQPVLAQYSVVNTSDADASVPALIKAQYGWIKFEVAARDGEFIAYRTGPQANAMSEVVTLKPGERLSSSVTVLTNAYGRLARTNLQFSNVPVFPFTDPGKYRIRASYLLGEPDSRGDAPRLLSNVVEFSITELPDAEREVLSFFTGVDEYAAAIGADHDVADLDAAVPRWEEFVERYPESIYTPAVRLHLGQIYLNGTGTVESDAGRAATHFRAAAKSTTTGLADDALLELAKTLIEVGRYDEAKAALAELLERFPGSERKAEAVRVRDGLAKGFRTLRDIYSN